MAVKYRQVCLNDTFSDCQDMFLDDVPSFFRSFPSTSTLTGLSLPGFSLLFTVPLGAFALIPYMVSSLLLSFRRFFLSPPILFSFIFPKNLGISAAFPRCCTLPSCRASSMTSSLISSKCSSSWLIILNPSVGLLIPPLHRCLPLIPSALNFMSQKSIPKLSMHLSENLKLSTRTTLMSIPIKWPHALPGCLLSRCRTYVLATDISFLDDDTFKSSHPELIAEKKSDSPDEDKHNPNIIHFS